MTLVARLVLLNAASAMLGISIGLACAGVRTETCGSFALAGCLGALVAIPRGW